MLRIRIIFPLLAFAFLTASGCTHLKGVVLEDRTNMPVASAVFTVGLPGGVGVFDRYPVDSDGQFDFYISPTDESHVYLWDGKGDPVLDVRRIDSREMSDHMKIYLPQR